jgi:hypothetical protein
VRRAASAVTLRASGGLLPVSQCVFQLAERKGLVLLHHAPSKVLGRLDSDDDSQ